VAIVDTNTPLTLLDRNTDAPRRLRTDLAVLSACSGENPLIGCENVERARYAAAAVIETHPCGVDGAACRVGLEPLDGFECGSAAGPDTVGYGAILGSDLLAQAALRIDLRDEAAPKIRYFPDIAGAPEFHCLTGVAVLETSFAGGATIQIEGGEVPYAAKRIPINACADYDVFADDEPSGTDLLLLLSTGLGPSVISETAYARYYQNLNAFCLRVPDRCGDEPDQLALPLLYSELPAQCLHLPSGPTVARVTTMRRVAMTGNSARARGPCEERRAARIMNLVGDCSEVTLCPCEDNKSSCKADATVDLQPADNIPVAVLPDTHPLLQGLREELRPGLAEIDGLLGLDAFHELMLDIDYTGSRLLVQCGEPSTPRPTCIAYPEVAVETATDGDSLCQ